MHLDADGDPPHWVLDGSGLFPKAGLGTSRLRPSAGDLLTHKWLTASATAVVGRVAKDLGHKLKRFQSNSRMKKAGIEDSGL